MVTKKEFLAKGKRGITYIGTYKKKTVVIKERNPKSTAIGNLENEFNFLKLLNKQNIGPEVYKFQKGKVIMQYVSGELIIDFFKSHNKEQILTVLTKIFKQLRTMDWLGINKDELTNPYKHIIVMKLNPVMIDFERCRKTKKPQNITQFCQFLTKVKIKKIFKEKGIIIDRLTLLEKAKAYKKGYSEKDYKEILAEVGL